MISKWKCKLGRIFACRVVLGQPEVNRCGYTGGCGTSMMSNTNHSMDFISHSLLVPVGITFLVNKMMAYFTRRFFGRVIPKSNSYIQSLEAKYVNFVIFVSKLLKLHYRHDIWAYYAKHTVPHIWMLERKNRNTCKLAKKTAYRSVLYNSRCKIDWSR